MPNVAPIDSAQYARSVREDTAELASYALSDMTSVHNSSPPPHHRSSAQSQLESYFAQGSDFDSTSNLESDQLSTSIIQEVSEPASLRDEPILHSSKTSGASALADLFKRTKSREPSPDVAEQGVPDAGKRASQVSNEPTADTEEREHEVYSHRTSVNATERSPLLPNLPTPESRDFTPLQGRRDLEGQETVIVKPSSSTIRKIVLWPREKGLGLAKTLTNPKKWDRAAIWRSAVVAPLSCLPAVALGLLLNILDALSYGMQLLYYPLSITNSGYVQV
jgi:SulP family sulfate permease